MTTIEFSHGSIFTSGCDALVSPVDATTGVQNKGLALQFKHRYPVACAAYRAHVRRVLGWDAGCVWAFRGTPTILFAATKWHWKAKSSLTIVQICCDELVRAARALQLRSIGIPALGCGLGELDWATVKPLLERAASQSGCDRVVIFEPKE